MPELRGHDSDYRSPNVRQDYARAILRRHPRPEVERATEAVCALVQRGEELERDLAAANDSMSLAEAARVLCEIDTVKRDLAVAKARLAVVTGRAK
jgi:hypothetical protein